MRRHWIETSSSAMSLRSPLPTLATNEKEAEPVTEALLHTGSRMRRETVPNDSGLRQSPVTSSSRASQLAALISVMRHTAMHLLDLSSCSTEWSHLRLPGPTCPFARRTCGSRKRSKRIDAQTSSQCHHTSTHNGSLSHADSLRHTSSHHLFRRHLMGQCSQLASIHSTTAMRESIHWSSSPAAACQNQN